MKRQLYFSYLTKWREFSPFQMERILVPAHGKNEKVLEIVLK
jgi:hypothetical protein